MLSDAMFDHLPVLAESVYCYLSDPILGDHYDADKKHRIAKSLADLIVDDLGYHDVVKQYGESSERATSKPMYVDYRSGNYLGVIEKYLSMSRERAQMYQLIMKQWSPALEAIRHDEDRHWQLLQLAREDARAHYY